MSINELMHNMHLWLNEEHFKNKISEEKGLPPFIVVVLGNDAKVRERSMIISLRLQETGNALRSEGEKASPIVSLEFNAELPIKFSAASAKDVASMLHFLNNELYLTGFHLDEANEKILFRHINFSLVSGIDKKLFIGTVGLILLYLDLYTNAIEEVASSKKTFNQVLEEVITSALYH